MLHLPLALAALFNFVSFAGAQSSSPANVEIIGQTTTFSTNQAIAASASPQVAKLLQSSRSGADFHITVTGLPATGLVELELGFAELQHTQAGQRVFEVLVNDKRAMENFDIVAAAEGPMRATSRRFTITPRRGFLDFHFVAVTGEASINYIRIKGKNVDRLITVPKDPTTLALSDATEGYNPADLPPWNPETGEISLDEMSSSWPAAMPVGGIGAGKLEVLPNGEFANLTINNNWDLPIPRVPGTFFAVAAKATSGSGYGRLLRVRTTDSSPNPYSNAKGFLSSAYKALFPFAELAFRDSEFPLNVKLESFSILIPQDESASSLPAAIFYVNVHNPKNYPIAAGVAFSWEDVSGRGGSRLAADQFPYAAGATFRDAATSSIQGIIISNTASTEGRRGTFMGDYFIGTPAKRAVISRVLNWNPRSGEIPWWRGFLRRMRLEVMPANAPATATGTGRGTSSGPGAAVICATVNIAPKETRRIPFIVSWYAPRVSTLASGAVASITEKQDYATTFGSSLGVAGYLAANRQKFEQGTREWYDMIVRSNLPLWLQAQTLNGLSPLLTNSILLDGGRFSMLESAGELGGMMGALDHRLAASPFLSTMFPALNRNELELYGKAQSPEGRLPRYVGNIHGGWTGMDPRQLGEDWTAPSASWLLQASAAYRSTGDSAFAQRIAASAEKALSYLQASDADGDGLPSGGSAWDDLAPAGSFRLAGGLKLAAAHRAAAELLRASGRAEAAGNAMSRATSITETLQPLVEDYAVAGQPTSATFAAVLGGDWALRQQGLGPIIPDELAGQALAAIESRHVKPFSPAIPMELNTDGSLVRGVRTSPLSLQPYLAAEALLAGKADLGLEVLRRAWEMAFSASKNAWQQGFTVTAPEGTSPKLRSHVSSLGSWATLQALSGVATDIPNRTLFLNPTVPTDLRGEMTLPVFTTAFWGWLDFDANDSTGTLAVTKVMPGYENFEFQRIAQRTDFDGKLAGELQLEKPYTLRDGEVLTLSGWPSREGGSVSVDNPELRIIAERKRQEEQARLDALTSGTDTLSTATTTLETESSDSGTSESVYGP